jgi:hypothetical protein
MKKSKREAADRPVCGTIWYLAFVCLAPVDAITTKALYARTLSEGRQIGPFQITAIRSAIVILLVLLFLNVKIKKFVYDGMKGKPLGSLGFRCVQSGVVIILKTMIVQQISLVLISIV